MPNHVTNILTINESEEKVRKFLDAVKGEKSDFDFNKIIPMPEELSIESCSTGEHGMSFLLGDKSALDGYDAKRREEAIRLGAKYLVNIALYGAQDWYDWCRANWGTKWNAYDIDVDGNKIRFDTAWNAPAPVYRKIAEMFPDYNIEIVYADEDCGYNAGRFLIEDGECTRHDEEDDSDGAYQCYFETHPGAEEEMHKDENGKWVWNEE